MAEDERYHSPTEKNILAALKWLVKLRLPLRRLIGILFLGAYMVHEVTIYIKASMMDSTKQYAPSISRRRAGMILDNEINEMYH